MRNGRRHRRRADYRHRNHEHSNTRKLENSKKNRLYKEEVFFVFSCFRGSRPVAGGSDFDFGGILRRRDAFFDERVPVVAVRALPEELGAAIAAAHADVRVEVEDRMPRQLAVAVDERRGWCSWPSARQIAWWMLSACGFCTSAAKSRSSASCGWPFAARCRDSASRPRQSCGFLRSTGGTAA